MNGDLIPLAIIAGLGLCVFLRFANDAKKKRISELEETDRNFRTWHQKEITRLQGKIKELTDVNAELARRLKRSNDRQRDLLALFDEKNKHFPWLALAFSDYQEYLGKVDEAALQKKKHPAPKAAAAVREASHRAADAERGFRQLKYRLDFIEKYFPWITDVTGDTLEDFLNQRGLEQGKSEPDESHDPVRQYLSQQEYDALSTEERNQLALDRWKQNRKSNWELGRMYERFVGYTYETKGYKVEYFGAIHGFDDLGRDLIARKSDEINIIQCKYWASAKTIHEKHIFQLFGTVVEFIARQNMKGDSLPLFGTFTKLADIKPVFTTSTTLSDRAREFARILNVDVRENEPLGEYPLIKCNVSKRTQEKLYHLPIDQMYDRTVIEPECGEFYAWTTAEAEEKGFRRAFRWRPEKGD